MAQDTPNVGDLYVFKGRQVKVIGLKKIGRGHSVYFEVDGQPAERARLADFAKAAERVA